MTRTSYREQKKNEQKLKRLKTIALFILVLITLTVGEFSDNEEIPSWSSVFSDFISQQQSLDASDIVVHVIDVGQGDCTLVQSGEYNVLIDAGENGMGSRVVSYLSRIGVDRLDWIIASHPHSDHMGGLDEVIEDIGADNIMMVYIPPEYPVDNSFYYSVLDAIENNGVSVYYANEGAKVVLGELELEVLHPTYGEYRDDMNDMSISLMLSCGDFRLLTCGDITYEIEEELISEGHDLDSTVVIANHHGSALSNSEEYILAASPEMVVFSCGANNSYGHPHNSVLNMLRQNKITYYRTDIHGTVVISCINGELKTETEK